MLDKSFITELPPRSRSNHHPPRAVTGLRKAESLLSPSPSPVHCRGQPTRATVASVLWMEMDEAQTSAVQDAAGMLALAVLGGTPKPSFEFHI